MRRRVEWIQETLKNPEAIYSHWEVAGRELCVNTIHEGEDDILGTMVVVVIAAVMGQRKLWTAFVPNHPEAYRQRIESGELLWKASP